MNGSLASQLLKLRLCGTTALNVELNFHTTSRLRNKRVTVWWLARAWRGPMSHSLVSSGRVDFGYRLVIGIAPMAIALMTEIHPVSERSEIRERWGAEFAACLFSW